eukprot:CAMPEP_0178983288 /NCGR_PEP_ID=MMETSP0795-20121207/975_1 /TAXON_ID=88552 /ORGANISM="Amoebophrya sp., Strain Ameob2" /LENGTH=1502 /DNA_ID=CAMNT_0020674041 /DNA_START=102 /DNA_END=4611 /DNA_ORIENTATION=+
MASSSSGSGRPPPYAAHQTSDRTGPPAGAPSRERRISSGGPASSSASAAGTNPAAEGPTLQPQAGNTTAAPLYKQVSFAFATVKSFNPVDGETMTEEHVDIEPLPPDSSERRNKRNRKTGFTRGGGDRSSNDSGSSGDGTRPGGARSGRPALRSVGSIAYAAGTRVLRGNSGDRMFNADDSEDDNFPAISEAFSFGKTRSPVRRLPSRIRRDSIGNLAAFFDPMEDEDEGDEEGGENGLSTNGVAELLEDNVNGAGGRAKEKEVRRISVISDNEDDVFAEAAASRGASGAGDEDSFFSGLGDLVNKHKGDGSKANSQPSSGGGPSELSSIRQVTGTADLPDFSLHNNSTHSIGAAGNLADPNASRSNHRDPRSNSTLNRGRLISPGPRTAASGGTPRSLEGSSKRRRGVNSGDRGYTYDITGQVPRSMAAMIDDLDPRQNLSGHFDAEFEAQQQEKQKLDEEIRRKSHIRAEGRDLLDEIAESDELDAAEPGTPSFGGEKAEGGRDEKHRSRRTFSSVGGNWNNNSSRDGGGSSVFDSFSNSRRRGHDSGFSMGGDHTGNVRFGPAAAYEMSPDDRRRLQRERRSSSLGGGDRPHSAGDSLSNDEESADSGGREAEELDEHKITIKVGAGVKDALARRPISIIPPEELAYHRAQEQRRKKRTSSDMQNGNSLLEAGGRGVLEDVGGAGDPGRSRHSASFMIPDVSVLDDGDVSNSSRRRKLGAYGEMSFLREQVGGSSGSRDRKSSAMWAMSFEEFKQNAQLGEVIGRTSEFVAKYKLPLDQGDEDVDVRKRAVGLVPSYPPLSVLSEFAAWQQKSAELPAVRELQQSAGSDDNEEIKQRLQNIAASAIEKMCAARAWDHYQERLKPFYEKQIAQLSRETDGVEEWREKLAAHVEKMEALLVERNAVEEGVLARQAKLERRKEEIKGMKAYGEQVQARIRASKLQVEQRRQTLQHQVEQSLLITSLDTDREVTDADLQTARKATCLLRHEIKKLKIENEKKRLLRQLSLWRARDARNDRLYLHPAGHELRLVDGLRWNFTPSIGNDVPLRFVEGLAPDMYASVWSKCRALLLEQNSQQHDGQNPGRPGSQPLVVAGDLGSTTCSTQLRNSWQLIFGYKLRQLDEFFRDLVAIPGCSYEDSEHFLIFHCMVCPSIEVNPTGFNEVYPIPRGAKRSYWMYDLLISRSELLRYAPYVNEIDWVSKLMVRVNDARGLSMWEDHRLAAGRRSGGGSSGGESGNQHSFKPTATTVIKPTIEQAIRDVCADESTRAKRTAKGALKMFIRDLNREVRIKILRDLEVRGAPEFAAYMRHQRAREGVLGRNGTTSTSGAGRMYSTTPGVSGDNTPEFNFGGPPAFVSGGAGGEGRSGAVGSMGGSMFGGSLQYGAQYGARPGGAGRGLFQGSGKGGGAGASYGGHNFSRTHPYARHEIPSPERSVLEVVLPKELRRNANRAALAHLARASREMHHVVEMESNVAAGRQKTPLGGNKVDRKANKYHVARRITF